MQILMPSLAFALLLSLPACDVSDTDALPTVSEDFPMNPQAGGTVPFEVSPCYTLNLPFDMQEVVVQGIDSNVARFDSETLRLVSDCGAYDVGYEGSLVAQQQVNIEGFDGSLYEYVGTFDQGEQIFEQVIVLHLTRPGGLSGFEHLDIAVFSEDLRQRAVSLSILASVREVWP